MPAALPVAFQVFSGIMDEWWIGVGVAAADFGAEGRLS